MTLNGNPITTIWFDLDDTLIDFTTNAHAALVKMWHDEPTLRTLFPDPETWVQRYEVHNLHLWNLYNHGQISRSHLRLQRFFRPLTDAGAPTDLALQTARRYDTLYLDYLARETALIPDAIPTLQRLHATPGIKIGILSNGFREVQHRKIANCGLQPYIDLTVLSDDIGVNKPDPQIYVHAMQRAADPIPSHHLMIGDNPTTDIQGALNSQWQAIWFNPNPSISPNPSQFSHSAQNPQSAPSPQGAIQITTLPQILQLLNQES